MESLEETVARLTAEIALLKMPRSTRLYNKNPEYRERRKADQRSRYQALTSEKKAVINEREKKRFAERYKTDEEFRKSKIEKMKERRAKLLEQGIKPVSYTLQKYQSDEEYRERLKAKARQYYHNKKLRLLENDRNNIPKNDHKNDE
jgi:hypothetical protein